MFLETGWGQQPRIAEAVLAIGPSRLVFGSDCPVQEPESQLKVLESLTRGGPLGINLNDDDLALILGGNLGELLDLT